jgi:hypothetical protein
VTSTFETTQLLRPSGSYPSIIVQFLSTVRHTHFFLDLTSANIYFVHSSPAQRSVVTKTVKFHVNFIPIVFFSQFRRTIRSNSPYLTHTTHLNTPSLGACVTQCVCCLTPQTPDRAVRSQWGTGKNLQSPSAKRKLLPFSSLSAFHSTK